MLQHHLLSSEELVVSPFWLSYFCDKRGSPSTRFHTLSSIWMNDFKTRQETPGQRSPSTALLQGLRQPKADKGSAATRWWLLRVEQNQAPSSLLQLMEQKYPSPICLKIEEILKVHISGRKPEGKEM